MDVCTKKNAAIYSAGTRKNTPKFFISLFLAFTLVLLLAACESGGDYAKVQNLTPATPIGPSAGELPPYRIQVGDVLDLKFRMNPELNETVTVRPDGMISTQIFQDVKVYDRTVSEVNDNLIKLYSRELTNPKVSTIVRSFAPTRIYVVGEVNNPGEFIVVGPTLTLTQAIARAGGTLNSANDSQVLILRNGAGDKGQIYTADYKNATQGADAAKDVRLAPYDVVFVPKTGAALTYKTYEQYLKQFISPSVGFSYNLKN